MEYLIDFFFLLVCLYSIKKLFTSDKPIWLMIGIMGTFSIGYYVLPVFFKEYAGLKGINEYLISEVLLLSLFFFLSIILGAITHLNISRKQLNLNFGEIDSIFFRYTKEIFIISFFIWLTYFLNNAVTSYSAANFEDFFHKKGTFDGLLAYLSIYALAAMVVTMTINYKLNNKIPTYAIVTFAIVTLLSLSGGQRLAAIKPLFMIIAGFSIYGFHKKGLKLMFTSLLILILISPLMVFIREFQGAKGKDKIIAASKMYNTGDSPIEKGFISIMERSDLISVMTTLKKDIDKPYSDFNYYQYLYSVLASFIPKFIMKDKPYPLSDTGDMQGETSVRAWILRHGSSTGSLSAFGAITAYREGGYIWSVLNGFLVGILLSFIAKTLGDGGHTSKFLFISIFVTLSIKNVPPSFFYVVVFIAPLINTIILLKIVNFLLRSLPKKRRL